MMQEDRRLEETRSPFRQAGDESREDAEYRVIFHVDVNSAFLSWSALKRLQENPDSVDLRTIPSAIGGDVNRRHGVITARSIPAKKYGVSTGEPVVSALRKCPNLVLEQPDFTVYREYSRRFIAILQTYSDRVEQVSIDEAFLDMTERFCKEELVRDHSPEGGFLTKGSDLLQLRERKGKIPEGAETKEAADGDAALPAGVHVPGGNPAEVHMAGGNPSGAHMPGGNPAGVHAPGGNPAALAVRLANEIYDTLGFTVNVGISGNKLLAKMASDFRKPGRVHTLWPEEIADKMWPLSIGELYGCGRKTAEKLWSIGIRTIGEAAVADPEMLSSYLGERAGLSIAAGANGISNDDVHSEEEEAKSYSNETTTSADITATNFDRDAVPVVRELSQSVARRLRRDGMFAGTIEVSVKSSDFHRYSRQTRLENSTNDPEVIFETAVRLLRKLLYGNGGLFRAGRGVRLIGVGGTNLDDGSCRQMDLFSYINAKENRKAGRADAQAEPGEGQQEADREKKQENSRGKTREDREGKRQEERQKKLEAMMQRIRAKYGENAVHRGKR